jgi:hypothetical protein
MLLRHALHTIQVCGSLIQPILQGTAASRRVMTKIATFGAPLG